MRVHPRYRVENGEHCVDLRIANVEQLFDNRDPAPFRERDLDPDLVEYLFAAAEDLAPLGPFRLVLWTATRPADDVTHAFRAHFEYELERLARTRRRHRRTGTISLLIGLAVLGVLLSIAQVLGRLAESGLRDALREGLVIFSWVMLWRPFDTLVFDWLPIRRERKLLARLHDAPIDVRFGKGPDAAVGPAVRPSAGERSIT